MEGEGVGSDRTCRPRKNACTMVHATVKLVMGDRCRGRGDGTRRMLSDGGVTVASGAVAEPRKGEACAAGSVAEEDHGEATLSCDTMVLSPSSFSCSVPSTPVFSFWTIPTTVVGSHSVVGAQNGEEESSSGSAARSRFFSSVSSGGSSSHVGVASTFSSSFLQSAFASTVEKEGCKVGLASVTEPTTSSSSSSGRSGMHTSFSSASAVSAFSSSFFSSSSSSSFGGGGGGAGSSFHAHEGERAWNATEEEMVLQWSSSFVIVVVVVSSPFFNANAPPCSTFSSRDFSTTPDTSWSPPARMWEGSSSSITADEAAGMKSAGDSSSTTTGEGNGNGDAVLLRTSLVRSLSVCVDRTKRERAPLPALFSSSSRWLDRVMVEEGEVLRVHGPASAATHARITRPPPRPPPTSHSPWRCVVVLEGCGRAFVRDPSRFPCREPFAEPAVHTTSEEAPDSPSHPLPPEEPPVSRYWLRSCTISTTST